MQTDELTDFHTSHIAGNILNIDLMGNSTQDGVNKNVIRNFKKYISSNMHQYQKRPLLFELD